MGLPHRKLYATNTGDESKMIFLTAWIPVKKEDGYHWPPDTPLGGDIWVKNSLGLKEEEGTVPVMIVKSEEETGTWLVCENGYFGNEQWLYNYKPRYREDDPTRIDHAWSQEHVKGDNVFGIHVSTDIDMVAGDGPYPVTLVRGEYPPRKWEMKKKESFWKRLFKRDR